MCTHTEGRIWSTSSGYMGRCLRQRLGSPFFLRDDERLLEPRRTNTPYQFKRAANDSLCLTDTRQNIRKLNHSDFFRQHHHHKVRQQIRKNCIRIPARRGNTNIRNTQQASARSTGISYQKFRTPKQTNSIGRCCRSTNGHHQNVGFSSYIIYGERGAWS